MLLSEKDMQLLEEEGNSRDRFVRYDKHGYAKLRNRRGYCVFYDVAGGRCKVYRLRPSGCRIYPVVCDEQKTVFVDDLCPMGRTVTKKELERKGNKVHDLLQRLEIEARSRGQCTKSQPFY